MKEIKVKLLVIFTLVLTTLGLAGCGKKDYKTFPDKYTLSSVDVGGMTAKEAKKAIKKAIDKYQIKVKLDDAEFEMNAEDLGLEYNEKADMQTLINAANRNKVPDKQVKLFNMKKGDEMQNALVDSYITAMTEAQTDSTSNTDNDTDDTKQADKSDAEIFDIKTVVPYRATITYNADAGQFEGVDGVSGDAPIYDKAATKLSSAVKEMKKKAELESSTGYVEGEKAADSDAVKKALKEADAYLDVTVTCNFNPATGEPATETVAKEQIAQWLIVGNDGLTVSLDGENMATYCTQLAQKHDVSKKKTGKFKTTSGDTIDVPVASSGQTVDGNKLYESIYEAIDGKKSTTVEAVYSEAKVEETGEFVTYGGNYCEVDLTNQMVYVYKDGKQVVSSQCVTGCIAKGHGTPTGVYSIFSMDKDRYLRGDGYKSWVNFFVPFNGGIGFHDASWRSTFGGNMYLYSGSHGCINMPYSEVKKLFANVSMGETVIVYGGATSVDGKEQSFTGQDAYSVTEGDASFNLGVTAQDNAKLTYVSDNEWVAKVDESGNVTPVGVGTATITVKSEATAGYRAGTKTITVTVNAKAQPQVQPQKPAQQQPQKPAQQQQPQKPAAKKDASVNVSESDVSLEINGIKKINISVSSDTGATVEVESGDASVATLDSNGNIVAKNEGQVTYKVYTKATGSYNASNVSYVTIKVSKPAEPDDSGADADRE